MTIEYLIYSVCILLSLEDNYCICTHFIALHITAFCNRTVELLHNFLDVIDMVLWNTREAERSRAHFLLIKELLSRHNVFVHANLLTFFKDGRDVLLYKLCDLWIRQ